MSKLPSNVIPVFAIPKSIVDELRAPERKLAKIKRKHEHALQKELRPVYAEIEDLVEKLRERFGLSTEHLFDTVTGSVVIRYAERQELQPLPDLPELVDPAASDDSDKE